MSGSTVEIEHVGPIDQVAVQLVPGRVTEIVGGNGAGKTTALRAIKAAVTGTNPGLTPSDGHKHGTISIAGLTLRIGLKLTKRGKAAETFVVVDDGDSLLQFINPGVKDPVAADRRRITAMLSIAGTTVDHTEFIAFLGPHLQHLANDIDGETLVECVDSLRKLLQATARDSEGSVRELDGKLSQIPQRDIPDGVDTSQLRADADAARDALRDARLRSDVAAKALARINALPDNADDLTAAEARHREAYRHEGELQKQLETLRAQMEEVKEQLQRAEMAVSKAGHAVELARQASEQREQARAAIADGVEPGELERLQKAADDATERLEAAIADERNAKAIRESQEHRAVLLRDREGYELRSSQARDKAANAATLLTAAIAQFEGWSVDSDLRLCCQHRRGAIPFGELSPGEQAVRVIEFTLRGSTSDGVGIAILPQEIWESLDVENREHVMDYAAKKQIAIVAARCAQEKMECPACLSPVGLYETTCPTCGEELPGRLTVKVLNHEIGD